MERRKCSNPWLENLAKVRFEAGWPNWFPPAEMLARRPDLPRFMRGGLDDPLGGASLVPWIDTLSNSRLE